MPDELFATSSGAQADEKQQPVRQFANGALQASGAIFGEDIAAQGSGGSGGAAPVSQFCGDFVRDVAGEDCDAGLEGSPACNGVCQTLDFLLVEAPDLPGVPVPAPAGRVLGAGRHPAAATEQALAVAFTESVEPVQVKVQLLDAWGNREVSVNIGQSASPATSANPVVAPLPDGSFAVAWNDLRVDDFALGIALRRLEPAGPSLGAVGLANQTTVGAQYDPDILGTTSGEVVVAWTDSSDPLNGPYVVARSFDAALEPASDEIVLGGSGLPEGNVVLARLGADWSAAWREAQPDGSEVLVVFTAGARWSIAVAQPGPAGDKPALVALDDEHLLVAYSVGTDPLGTGVANTPRLEAAVVDTASGTVVLLGAVEPLEPGYAGTSPEVLAIGQSQPGAVRVGQRTYLSWTSGAISGSAAGSELWLKHLPWDATSEELSLVEAELAVARWPEHRAGDQLFPALAATPLLPEGALLLAWDDYGVGFHAHQGRPDVAVQLAPVPIRRGPPAATLRVIDDFEDGDDLILAHDGRIGGWVAFNDGTGTQSPAPGVGNFAPSAPGRDSGYAARTTGSGFTSWGAGIGFDLSNDGSGKQVYDASGYVGVSFWARAEAPVVVRFNVSDVNTDPDGGVCTSCFDHFGVDVALTTEWHKYLFVWSLLGQQGWGSPQTAIDTTQLYGMQLQVGPNQSFDLWVDDVALVPDWNLELIDDLEDGDGFILAQSGRQGRWFTENDGSMGGSQAPAPGSPFAPGTPGFDSTYAARTSGSGFTVWGAALDVELNNDGTTKSTYDATGYDGITFWARAGGTLPIRVMVADVDTDPDGGICSNCFDHFGTNLTLSSDWQRFTLSWGQLFQQGWGDAFGRLQVDRLYAVQLLLPPNASFDLSVDNLAFLVGGAP